jgi:hypothetical protein
MQQRDQRRLAEIGRCDESGENAEKNGEQGYGQGHRRKSNDAENRKQNRQDLANAKD